MAAQHQHDKPVGGPNDGAFDWFKVLDWAVWGAVIVIAAIALEAFYGKVIRERISAGASRWLAKTDA